MAILDLIKNNKLRVVIAFGALILVLSFAKIILANTPDNPTPAGAWTNISVCTDPPKTTTDISGNPVINYTTAGQNMIHRWVKIFFDLSMTQLVFDSGFAENLAYAYNQQSSSDTQPAPRCACDTDSNNQNCASSFSASAGDPATCYDWYVRSWQEQTGTSCINVGWPYDYGCSYYYGPSYYWVCDQSCYDENVGLYCCASSCCTPTYTTYTANASYRYDKAVASVPAGTYSYAVPPGVLSSGNSYYYKVAVQSSYNNEWTPWATGVLCNHPPMPVPQAAVQPDYCAISSPSVTLSWGFTDAKTGGDTLSAYYLQISENSGFAPLLIDTGKISSGSNTSFATSAISWGKTYYWRLKVWDSCDVVSNGNNWTNGPSFSTISHAKPKPDFSWFPANPAKDETVLFRDQSIAYGGYAIKDGTRVWTFQDSTMVRDSQLSPIVKFNSDGSKTVTLTVTDTSPEAFTCTASKTVIVGGAAANSSNLPCWREINPR